MGMAETSEHRSHGDGVCGCGGGGGGGGELTYIYFQVDTRLLCYP